jgi:CheY-like chemotaxis protein
MPKDRNNLAGRNANASANSHRAHFFLDEDKQETMVNDQNSSNSSSCNTSITDKSDNKKPLTKEDLIHKLNTADVLLGRGTPTVNYPGNVAFRQLIKQRKAEYTASSKHKTKDRMAREVMTQILDKGGRFLRCVDPIELEPLGLSLPPLPDNNTAANGDQKVWAAVDEEVALEKIKQALRDKDHCSYYRSRAKAAMALMKQKHEEQQAQLEQQQQQVPHQQQRHPSLPPSSNNHLLLGGGSGGAMNIHRGPSPLLGLPQGIVMQHLMNQHNTSMVMAHLQQQMQRKQLIKDLLFMEDQNRRAEAALLGNNPHLYDGLKALAGYQQQQHQQPLFALANNFHNNVVPPPPPASSAAFLYR